MRKETLRDSPATDVGRRLLRHPVRAWVFGLVLGAVAGAASIYLLAYPPAGGTIAGTTAPGN